MRQLLILKLSLLVNVVLISIWYFQRSYTDLALEECIPQRVSDKSIKSDSGATTVKESDYLTFHLDTVDCQVQKSYKNAKIKTKNKSFLSEPQIIERTQDCSVYFELIKPNIHENSMSTPEERAFPLAFAITTHHEIGILEMFLALYVRPKDSYCIHVDEKAKPVIHRAAQAIVNCYNEMFPKTDIFIASRTIPVYWGNGGSILEAELICYRELLRRNKAWKAMADIAGTELPLVSVQRFRENIKNAGGNIMHIMYNPAKERQTQSWEIRRHGTKEYDLRPTLNSKGDPGPIPCGLYVFKGVKSGAFTRHFINFILKHPFSIEYFNWIYNTGHPEEHFVSTLASLSVTRKGRKYYITQRFDEGVYKQRDWYTEAFTGQDAEDACYREYLFDRTFRPPMCNITKEVCQYNIDNHEGGLLALAEQWTHQVCFRGALWDENCTGHINHGVCTLAWDDLTLMRDKFCMIANKFDSGIDANAIMCMVKDIRGLTRDYQKGVPQNGV